MNPSQKMSRLQSIFMDAINQDVELDDILLFPPPQSVLERESQLILNGTAEGDNDLVTILIEQYVIEKEDTTRLLLSGELTISDYYDMQDDVGEIVANTWVETFYSKFGIYLPYVVISVLSWNKTFDWFMNVTEDKLGYKL